MHDLSLDYLVTFYNMIENTDWLLLNFNKQCGLYFLFFFCYALRSLQYQSIFVFSLFIVTYYFLVLQCF